MPLRAVPVLVGVAVAGVYAWWATGLSSFTALSYLAVAMPAALVLVATVTRRSRVRATDAPSVASPRRASRDTIAWAVLTAGAVGLEAVGLALGGRSRSVPTLSDVTDRLIAPHPVRALAFLGWLALGFLAVGAASRRAVNRR
jgi:hypothetical protein